MSIGHLLSTGLRKLIQNLQCPVTTVPRLKSPQAEVISNWCFLMTLIPTFVTDLQTVEYFVPLHHFLIRPDYFSVCNRLIGPIYHICLV